MERKESENHILVPDRSGGQQVHIQSDGPNSQENHRPEGTEKLLQAQAWAGRYWYREVGHPKRHPLSGSGRVRVISGIVEETEGKEEKEGKGNLEHQPGYQLTGKELIKTFGWVMRTDGGRCI